MLIVAEVLVPSHHTLSIVIYIFLFSIQGQINY